MKNSAYNTVMNKTSPLVVENNSRRICEMKKEHVTKRWYFRRINEIHDMCIARLEVRKSILGGYPPPIDDLWEKSVNKRLWCLFNKETALFYL